MGANPLWDLRQFGDQRMNLHIQAEVTFTSQEIQLNFWVRGADLDAIDWGSIDSATRAVGARTDRLWEKTCFEFFWGGRERSAPYREFNLSPQGQWNLYQLKSYRAELIQDQSGILQGFSFEKLSGEVRVQAEIVFPSSEITGTNNFGNLACVIREKDGATSYWSSGKSTGSKPDFHDPASRTVRL